MGLKCYSIDELAESLGSSSVEDGERVVDTGKLYTLIPDALGSRCVVYGHLLPHVVPRLKVEGAMVLRCEPSVLRERLERRGYPHKKVRDNVEAELIGVVASETRRAFGKVGELDTTSAVPDEVAVAIWHAAKERSWGGLRIDWTRNYDSAAKLRSLLDEGDAQSAST